jgi:hypothetical protein
MRKLTCPPGTETLGLLLSAFADNIQGDETRPVMEKHGMVNLAPMEWYPAQTLLDALNELGENPNTLFNFIAIGMGIGETVPMPPGVENPSLEQVLHLWDSLYQGLHRGGDAGKISIEKVNDTYFKTYQNGLYPDDMSYGVLYAYGKRFLPLGTHYSVFYEPDSPSRDQGGEQTIISIQWSAF